MSDEALARLPSRDNIKRRIRMLRQDKKLPSAPNDPNFPNVPTALTVTSRGDKFLRCDTGPDILQSCDDFLVDGIFKILGYQNRYQEDVKFAHNINKIAASAFIPPCDVLHAYSRLALDLDNDYQDILNYFEDTYIGRLRPNNTRRQPTFSIEFWNMHTRTTQLSMRTNNSVEAWHRRIGCVFQCAQPTLWSFLQKLIHEEHATHADVVHINSGEAPKHKSKTNERFERRLLNLLLHPHDDILMQLNNIAQNICL
ncbi:unnamed protein product [Didymodactylos carnosus]|uniref:Uncharacterized protein n=1 Tax=Didymodactylos carnosus TaxID=1234261 RepID=A0A814IVC9_9BILA|nr:unnamed protein product [Didymodactylos carnosus]CAF3800406.1 unnamed protein product [Didymodactylos carnosus]